MQNSINTITENKRFQFLLFFFAVIAIFQIFIPYKGIVFLEIINEVLILSFTALFVLNLILIEFKKKYHPLKITSSFLAAFGLLLMSIIVLNITMNVFGISHSDFSPSPGLFEKIIILLFNSVIFVVSVYVLVSLRELFYLRTVKNINTYYNAMIVFIVLASVTSVFNEEAYKEYNFIYLAFTVNAIILIFLNSLRISWIAFLRVKQKRQLLLVSVILVVLSIIILIQTTDENFQSASKSFSYFLHNFNNLIIINVMIYSFVIFFTTLFHLPTAEVFDKKSREVSSMQYFSKLINQALDSKELIHTISDLGIEIGGSDAIFLNLDLDGDSKVIGVKNLSDSDANKIAAYTNSLTPGFGVNYVVLKEFNNKQHPENRFASVYIAALKSYAKLHGHLYFLKYSEISLDEEDKKMLETFADYSAIALENSYLLRESIEKERLEKELDVARKMQMSIVPAEAPKLRNAEISCSFIPAFEVGGDYYDFFTLSENKLGIIIADVSGKGISAAFIMAELRGIFESLTKLKQEPKDILIFVNQILNRILDRKSFISAVFAVLDLETGELVLSRAGHCPPVLLSNGVINLIRPEGIALGMNYQGKFDGFLEEVKFTLKDDDLLFLYTDGVTESKNSTLEDFGENRLYEIIKNYGDCSPDEITNKLIKEITIFSENNSQHDDISFIILKWNKNKTGEING
ncbi:MAG: serine/threonine-protein phosphatase [Ignavibacteriaceae bacterium]|nr:serine/threonine-protein phosphatase [Ignavibacteriaceae bacterium]